MLNNPSITIPDRLQVGTLGVVGGILWATSGIEGVLLVAVIGVAWTVIETPYVVAGGQLLYGVGIAETSIVSVVGVVSFGILFIPELLKQWELQTAVLGIGVLGGATAIFAMTVLVESTIYAAVGLSFGFGIVAYSIHRYELVRFGLVTTNP